MALSIEQRAFLDLIAYCEGTIGRSANGYDLLFGGKKVMNGWEANTNKIRHRYVTDFGNYKATPSLKIQDPTWKSGASTAAGRYQFLGWVWASETKRKFNDENAYMTKENQDNLAWLLAEGRGMNNEKLKKGLTSKSEFESTVKTLCRNREGDVCIWEAFYKIFVTKNYGITIDQAFEFYKGAYQKYKDRGNNGTQAIQNSDDIDSSGLGALLYLNQQGQKIEKFGTQKITSNGDTTKFYVNIPSGSPDKIIYFWSGLESVISREAQWNQIPQNIKNKCYIVMAAGTTNTNQNSLDDLRSVIKKYNSSIKTNQLKEYIMGYSAGGYSVFNNYDKKFKFVGLIDPSLSSETNTENRKYDKNVAMIWGSSGMIGISNWGVRYPKVNDKIKDDGGFSQKINDLDHGKAIQIWFDKYGNKIIDGQTVQEDEEDNNQNNLKPKSAVGCDGNSFGIGLNNSGNLSGAKNVIVGSSSVKVLGQIPSNTGQYGGFYSNKIYTYYNCGGKTLTWLREQIKNDTNTYTNVKKFFQVGIGTNDGFPTSDAQKSQIKQYTDLVKEKFPNATLYVFPGTYGWGSVINKTEEQVLNYYKQYTDLGWTLLRPKNSSNNFISSNLPQGNHDPNNEWFQGQMKLLKQNKA